MEHMRLLPNIRSGFVCLLLMLGLFEAESPSVFASDLTVEAIQGVAPDGQGGGEIVVAEVSPHLTLQQRQMIWIAIEENVALLRGQGKLPFAPELESQVVLGWPLKAVPTLKDFGYHGTSNFVDQNPSFPDALLDYNCGARTYDTASGYNHQGIDYFLWPFPWLRMDNSQIEIVAAADGTIVYKTDGNYDRSCGFNSGMWNAVYIQHPDGSIAWYGHMKNGSVTQKLVGATVTQGEPLGVVGSSGNSTGPHLHFEIYNSEGQLNEPYSGPCNSLNSSSWWATQPPYYDSAINHTGTGFADPVFPACPNQESPNEATVFDPGDQVYFLTYYRDQLDSQTTTYTIYRPDGGVYSSWNHNSNAPHYAASYWYWWYTNFAPGGPQGIWRFEQTYEGRTSRHFFSLGPPAGSGRVPGQQNDPVSLSVARDGDQVVLEWDVSCLSSDVDYEVYEGTIGLWYSHVPRACTTDGNTSATVTPGSDIAYYIVVPTNLINEGSYGLSTLGGERPPGLSSCLIQTIGLCP